MLNACHLDQRPHCSIMPNQKRKRRSPAWNYFRSNDDKTYAECSVCLKSIRTNGGCTTGLTRHLETHNIYLKNDDSQSSKKLAVDNIEIITKLVALDGLPFSVVANSSSIRYLYEASTSLPLPNSPNTIREILLKCYDEKKVETIRQLDEIKSNGKKLSLTLDEWTSAANKRYMNVNIHTVGMFWNLGLIRITGSLTAEASVDLLNEKLLEFDVRLKDDIFGVSTDGAAVMKKFGHLSGRQHALCIVHGIHLAVVAVLYKNNNEPDKEVEASDEDDEDIFAMEPPLVDATDDECELVVDLKEVIFKVRKVVKLFRKSPLKSEILAQYSLSGLTLLLDTKTRWNSMLAMLERVSQLKEAIQKAMIDLKEHPILTETDFNIIEELIQILKPVKVAVDGLCRRDSNLITADVALTFMMSKLSSNISKLGKQLYEELKIRILERRTFLSDVTSYLHYGNENDLPGHKLGIFKKPARTALTLQIKAIHEMFSTIPIEQTQICYDENSQASESLLADITMESELSSAINEAVSYKPRGTRNAGNKPTRDPSAADLAAIKREMLMLEGLGVRGKILQTVFDLVITVQPSTVESERAFSCANNFCRKVRTRLGDLSLNALVFLKAYYLKHMS